MKKIRPPYKPIKRRPPYTPKPIFTAKQILSSPNRDVTISNIGNNILKSYNDSVGANTYKLKGTYSYEHIVSLNDCINVKEPTSTHYCGFGFTKELGNIAFIGIPKENLCNKSGYFKYNIHSYGKSIDESTVYFNVYSDEEAKKHTDYIVYGHNGIKDIAAKVDIEELDYNHDSRFKSKFSPFYTNTQNDILTMDLKLKGEYTFDKARLLATGSKEDKDFFTGEEHPIYFAVVDETNYIGIINYSMEPHKFLKFRDVWEYGKPEPAVQALRFLTDKEARKIDKFTLYVYIYPFSLRCKTYPIEKQDRTFNSKYSFKITNGPLLGMDTRLI